MSPTSGRHPRRRRTRRIPALTLVLSLAVVALVATCGLAVHSWIARARVEAGLASTEQLLLLGGEIARLDEALTMSARMAAATGDPAWERRYRGGEPKLEAAIARAERLDADVAGPLLRDLRRANAALVSFEHSAMARAAAGDRDGALALLEGQAYTGHKERYREALGRLAVALGERAGRDASASALQAVLWVCALASVAAVVTLLAVALILRDRQCTRLELLAREADRRAALAEKVGRARSEFIARMTQGIRAPASAVLGMADLLLDTPLLPDQRRFADTIRSGASSLVGAIDDAVDVAKIEAGQLEIESGPLDLAALVDEVAAVMAPRAHAKGLELVCSVAPSMPRPLVGDPVRVRRVLLHLVGNAIDFTRDGEVVVRVTVAGRDAAGGSIRCEVRDTGIGIAEAERPRLFRTFSRLEASSPRAAGLGLGLALSRQLAEAMGGHIGVESEPGHGSTFWFTARVAVPAAAAPAVAPVDLSGVRVLVADDSHAACSVLLELLAHWGARALGATDEPSAVARWRTSIADHDPFALVLLDAGLDGAGGTRLASTLRAGGGPLPRIVVLGETGREPASALAEIGASAAVPKPVRRSDLAHAIATALEAPATASRAAGRRPGRSTREPKVAAGGGRRGA
jgi:signal transduction histidine kinase/FixJ family two-component response regulator